MLVDRKKLIPLAVGGVVIVGGVIVGGIVIYQRNQKSLEKESQANSEEQGQKCATLLAQFEAARADASVSKIKLKELFDAGFLYCPTEFDEFKKDYVKPEEDKKKETNEPEDDKKNKDLTNEPNDKKDKDITEENKNKDNTDSEGGDKKNKETTTKPGDKETGTNKENQEPKGDNKNAFDGRNTTSNSDKTKVNADDAKKDETSGDKNKETQAANQKTLGKKANEKLEITSNSLLRKAQELNLDPKIIKLISDFSSTRSKENLISILSSLVEPKLSEEKFKLGEEYTEFLKTKVPDALTDIDEVRSELIDAKSIIIRDFAKYKPHLAQERVQELRNISLDLLDPQSKYPEQIKILKEILNLESLIEFDSVRAVNTVLLMHNAFFKIREYESLWEDMPSPFQSLIAASKEDPPIISNPACTELLKAKSIQEWNSKLGLAVISDDQNVSADLLNIVSFFSTENVLGPQSLCLADLKNASKDHKQLVKKMQDIFNGVIEGEENIEVTDGHVAKKSEGEKNGNISNIVPDETKTISDFDRKVDDTKVSLEGGKKDESSGVKNNETQGANQPTPEQKAIEKLEIKSKSLLKNAQDLNLGTEIVNRISAFSVLKRKDNLVFILQTPSKPELAEQIMELGEEYIELLQTKSPSTTTETDITEIRASLRYSKKFIIKDFANYKTHLKQERIQDLISTSLDLLDIQKKYPEQITALKEILKIESPSEFDSIRAVGLVWAMDKMHFYEIEKYVSLWEDMSAPFQSLLAASKSFSKISSITNAACIELLRAKTPQEWTSKLDNAIIDNNENSDDLSSIKSIFSSEKVLSPQSPFIIALSKACEAQKKVFIAKEKNSIAMDMAKALVEGNNVANEGSKVSNELFLLKPFGEYLAARDGVLGNTSGFQNWTLFNAGFILKREANPQSDEELLKVLSPLVQKDLREASEVNVSNFLKFAKNGFLSDLDSINSILLSRTFSSSKILGHLISKVVDELEKPDVDFNRLSQDLIAMDKVEAGIYYTFNDLVFADVKQSIQFFFPLFCTKLSPELMRAAVPLTIRIPSNEIMKSQAMIKLGDQLISWYETVRYRKVAPDTAGSIKKYYDSERTFAPDVGFILDWNHCYSYTYIGGNFVVAYKEICKVLEKEFSC